MPPRSNHPVNRFSYIPLSVLCVQWCSSRMSYRRKCVLSCSIVRLLRVNPLFAINSGLFSLVAGSRPSLSNRLCGVCRRWIRFVAGRHQIGNLNSINHQPVRNKAGKIRLLNVVVVGLSWTPCHLHYHRPTIHSVAVAEWEMEFGSRPGVVLNLRQRDRDRQGRVSGR